MFDDAFTSIARDGARSVEVAVRLQKALAAISACGNDSMKSAAREHFREALERAPSALNLSNDFEKVLAAARQNDPDLE